MSTGVKILVWCVLVCVCTVPTMATMVFSSNFEGSGAEGWGISTDGQLSYNYDWADNGPSMTGSQCLYLYPMAGPYPTYVAAYHWIYPTQQQSTLNQFVLSYDEKGVVGSMTQYWQVQFTYSDGTPSEIRDVGSVLTSSTWQAFSVSLNPTNGGHPLSSILIKYYYLPYTSGGSYWNRLDNVVLTGTPEPATVAILGLGGLAALRRRR